MNKENHIYLIDDDESICRALSSVLTKIGYAVTVFYNPRIFLDYVENLIYPSVILLDVKMSEMSGLELQAELNSRDCKIPIIFMSGQANVQIIVDSFKQGTIDFLLKPFLLEDLVQSLKNIG